MTRRRVIVTGSRDWDDVDEIDRLLRKVHARDPEAVLVVGDCPTGADAIATRIWDQLGGLVEVHAADWSKGKRAGPERNARMVRMTADVCLAFIKDASPGATGCAQMAERAGIPVRRYVRTSRGEGVAGVQTLTS